MIINHLWSRQESNLHLMFRKHLFYPLNYGTNHANTLKSLIRRLSNSKANHGIKGCKFNKKSYITHNHYEQSCFTQLTDPLIIKSIQLIIAVHQRLICINHYITYFTLFTLNGIQQFQLYMMLPLWQQIIPC